MTATESMKILGPMMIFNRKEISSVYSNKLLIDSEIWQLKRNSLKCIPHFNSNCSLGN